MSIRSAVRRWGVPASAVASILIPILIAGCDDAPDELSAMMQLANCPHECVNCYHELMGYDLIGAHPADNVVRDTTDLWNDLPDDQQAEYTELGSPPAGETDPDDADPDDADPGDADPDETGTGDEETPGTLSRPRVPDAVLRPRVDPNLGGSVPKVPSYPPGPKTTPYPKSPKKN